MQTKLESAIESSVQTTIAFGLALLTQNIVFPLYGIYITHTDSFTIAVIFTIVSITRSYLVRRYYNWRMVRKMDREFNSTIE